MMWLKTFGHSQNLSYRLDADTTKYENGDSTRGTAPSAGVVGVSPHIPQISPQEWGAGGLKELF